MADKKISQLNEVINPNNTDFLPVVNAGLTKKVTLDNLVQQSTYSTNNIGSLTLQSNLNSTDQVPIATGAGLPRKVPGSVFATSTQVQTLTGILDTKILSVSSVTATGTLSARTLQDRFADIINIKDFGAVGDGVTDDTAAIQAALNAGQNSIVFFPTGSYKITQRVNIKSDTIINAYCANFICSNSDNVFFFETAIPYIPTTTYSLISNANTGTNTLYISSVFGSNFFENDLVLIAKTTTLSGQQPYREINTVQAVSGGQIIFNAPFNFNYTVGESAFISKVNSCRNSKWYGGTFNLSGISTGFGDRNAFSAWWARDCQVNDIVVKNHPYKTVDFYGCYNCYMKNIVGLDPLYLGPGEGYNGRFTYSRFCVAENIYSENVRHGFDVTGGSDYIINNVHTAGRTAGAPYSSGPFLHGLLSQRTIINNIVSNDVYYGVIAGNGSFANDIDFVINNLTTNRCTNAVSVQVGCRNFSINNVKACNSLEETFLVYDSLNGNISNSIITNLPSVSAYNILLNNCQNFVLQGLNINSIRTINSQDLIIQGLNINSNRPTNTINFTNSKATLSDSRIVAVSGNTIIIQSSDAECYLNNCYIDHSGNGVAIYGDNLSVLRVANSVIKNRTNNTSIDINNSNMVNINNSSIVGLVSIPLRGIRLSNINQAHINNNTIQRANEGIRIENTPDKALFVSNNLLYDCTNALRTTLSSTKVIYNNNFTENTSNKMINTSADFVFGNVFSQGGITTQGDNNVTLRVGVDAQIQRFDTTLSANRTVTLSIASTEVFDGATFTVVRTGLGPHSLSVVSGSGSTIKVIPSLSAASVTATYSKNDWKLVSYNTL